MREYKFRGKRIDNGEWVHGNLITNPKGRAWITPIANTPNERTKFTTLIALKEVDPNTVGQYTGLKDKNGVEVYEGDTISFDDNDGIDECWHGLIEFCMNGWQCNDIYDDSTWMWVEDLQNDETIEGVIIGNIHEVSNEN